MLRHEPTAARDNPIQNRTPDWKSCVIAVDAFRIWTLAEARDRHRFLSGSRRCPWDPNLGFQNVHTATPDQVLPPELVADEPAAAAVQDRWPPHSARPILHPATRRELLDIDSLSANPPACRATRVASDVIERTAQKGSRIDASRGVSEGGSPRGQALEHAGPAAQNPEKAPWCLFRTGGRAGWSTCGVLRVTGGRRNWLHIGNPG